MRPWKPLLVVCLLSLVAGAAKAASSVYRFEPVEQTVERGAGAILKVRVIDTTSNSPVPNIEIRAPSVDRSPDGFADAKRPAFFAPSQDYGVYSFRADLSTDGNWALTFTAVVPGQRQPILASVIFKVAGRASTPRPAGGREEPQKRIGPR
jgi:hypothetical protein